MTTSQRTLGSYLRDRRTEAGISLREAAQRVGISHVFLGAVERGRKSLPQSHWAAIESAIPGVEREVLAELSSDAEANYQLRLRDAGPVFEEIGQALLRRADRRDMHADQLQQLLRLLRGDEK